MAQQALTNLGRFAGVAAAGAFTVSQCIYNVDGGERAVMLFVVQRTDCNAFAACHDLDPAYARGLTDAATAGVEVLVRACEITTEAVRIADRVPWVGNPG